MVGNGRPWGKWKSGLRPSWPWATTLRRTWATNPTPAKTGKHSHKDSDSCHSDNRLSWEILMIYCVRRTYWCVHLPRRGQFWIDITTSRNQVPQPYVYQMFAQNKSILEIRCSSNIIMPMLFHVQNEKKQIPQTAFPHFFSPQKCRGAKVLRKKSVRVIETHQWHSHPRR